MSSSHVHPLAPLCCSWKLRFSDSFPSATSPWKCEPGSGSDVWACLVSLVRCHRAALTQKQEAGSPLVADECERSLGCTGDAFLLLGCKKPAHPAHGSANTCSSLHPPSLAWKSTRMKCGRWPCHVRIAAPCFVCRNLLLKPTNWIKMHRRNKSFR